jgi:hypothetical protein
VRNEELGMKNGVKKMKRVKLAHELHNDCHPVFFIFSLLFFILLASCIIGEPVITERNLVFTDVNKISTYLDKQQIGYDPNNPIKLTVKIDLGEMKGGGGWGELLMIIQTRTKYVGLDLSGCTMKEETFNPSLSPAPGKNFIVSLILPKEVKAVAGFTDNIFTSLKSIYAAEVETIYTDAFKGCGSLEKADFPRATHISDRAFMECGWLATVNIPQVAQIGESVFGFSSSGTDLIITMGSKAPSLGKNIFTDVYADKKVTVKIPYGVKGYYEDWGNGFRGAGWNGDIIEDLLSVNIYIILNFEEYK